MQNLTPGRKIAYAMGGMAMNLTNLVISQLLFYRYIPDPDKGTVLIPATAIAAGTLFGILMTAGRLTDGITDPLVAFWSDQSQSKRGRRIPFVLWGLLPFCLVFFLLWTPPVESASWTNAAYVFIMIQLYFILYTIVVTPYLALLPELTGDLKERVNITTLQAVFVMVGTFIFGISGPLVAFGGWWVLGLTVAILSLISFLPTIFAIKENPAAIASVQKLSMWKWLLMTLQNKPFRFVIVSTSLYWFGLNLLLMVIPAWVESFLELTKADMPLLMMPFLVVNVIFFFVFNTLSKKYGKYAMYLVTCFGSGIVVPLLYFVGSLPGSPLVWSAVILGLAGIPTAGFMMLPFAILSDAVDIDEERTGQRREGIFFGTQAIFQKSAIGFSVAFFPVVAQSAGQFTEMGLKMVAISAAAFFILAGISFLRYPIREVAGKATLVS